MDDGPRRRLQPQRGMAARAAGAIGDSEAWTDATPMLNLSSFVTTYVEPRSSRAVSLRRSAHGRMHSHRWRFGNVLANASSAFNGGISSHGPPPIGPRTEAVWSVAIILGHVLRRSASRERPFRVSDAWSHDFNDQREARDAGHRSVRAEGRWNSL